MPQSTPLENRRPRHQPQARNVLSWPRPYVQLVAYVSYRIPPEDPCIMHTYLRPGPVRYRILLNWLVHIRETARVDSDIELSLPEQLSSPLSSSTLFVSSIPPFLGCPMKIDFSGGFRWVELSLRSPWSPPPSKRNPISLGLCPCSVIREHIKAQISEMYFYLPDELCSDRTLPYARFL
jgi:hypothetical protein